MNEVIVVNAEKSIIMKITVIGAGNGGQAIAGYCAYQGYSVCLYDRSIEA